jgi:hypothetical protein
VFSGQGPAPGAPAGGGGSEQLIQGVVTLARQMEQTLITFAQAMPEGAQEFKAASDAIKMGIAKSMAANTQGGGAAPPAPVSSPTEPGVQFPGGGFGSAPRP